MAESAWIGGVVSHSTNQNLIPIGATIIALVRDLGGNGEDIMHGEFFAPEVLRTDEPAMPETVVL